MGRSFCFNSLTANYLILDRNTYKWLIYKTKNLNKANNKKLTIKEKNILKSLIKNDLLISKKGEDVKKISRQRKYHKSVLRKKKKLIFLGFCMTDNCNFRCSYCIKKKCNSSNKKKTYLRFKTAKKRIDQFIELAIKNKIKKVTIAFGGGEPLLNFSVLKKIVNYAKEKSKEKVFIDFEITTNSALLNEKIIKFLALNKFDVGVSLDGLRKSNLGRKYKDGTETFKDVLRSLKLIMKEINSKKITIGSVIHNQNVGLIRNNFLDFIKNLGIKKVCIEPDMVGFIKCNYDKLLKNVINLYSYGSRIGLEVTGYWQKPFKNLIFKKNIASCPSFAGTAITIDVMGQIRPCIYLNEYKTSKEIKDIFSGNYIDFIEKNWTCNISQCKNCELEGACMGGCYLTRKIGDSKIFKLRCRLFKDMTKFLIKEMLKENYSQIKKELK
ncbi:MAG: 4Fe-4S cluster-binding domain-containing protein [Candidatus Portnoybacteria bacterium]|nr:4Fe-4S cluster-binding domain-containing protein [Candidatus Portnoybacteria bacterium]